VAKFAIYLTLGAVKYGGLKLDKYLQEKGIQKIADIATDDEFRQIVNRVALYLTLCIHEYLEKFKPKDNNNLEKVDKKEIKNLAKFASLRIFQHLMRNKIDDENPVENLPRALYKSVGVLSKEDKNQKKKEKKASKMEQKAKKKARNIKTKETKEKNEKGKNKIEYVSDILEIIINKICSVNVSTKID